MNFEKPLVYSKVKFPLGHFNLRVYVQKRRKIHPTTTRVLAVLTIDCGQNALMETFQHSQFDGSIIKSNRAPNVMYFRLYTAANGSDGVCKPWGDQC